MIPIRDALEPEFKIVQIDIKVPTDDTNVNILVFNSKFRNRSVPEVLLSGNHRHIDQWRLDHRESRTIKYRPDLWKKYVKIKESEN